MALVFSVTLAPDRSRDSGIGSWAVDRNTLETVGDMNNKSVFVAGNVEDEGIVTDKIEIGTNVALTSEGLPNQRRGLSHTWFSKAFRLGHGPPKTSSMCPVLRRHETGACR